jgi:PEP-CTERM motif
MREGNAMRKQLELRPRLERKLSGYLTAASGGHKSVLKDLLAWAVPAGTVGLGILGGSELALANTIVYTPADMQMNWICLNSIACNPGAAPARYSGTLAFDVNHDEVNDFRFLGHLTSDIDSRLGFVDAGGARPGAGVAVGAKGALALSTGARIGYGLNFGGGLMVSGITYFYRRSHDRVSGSWATQSGGNVNAFLGLEFKVGALTYFGWAEFDAGFQGILNATLEGYAYNSVPGQGLYAGQTNNAPEPGTLGLLALGSLGLGFWRRKAGSTA